MSKTSVLTATPRIKTNLTTQAMSSTMLSYLSCYLQVRCLRYPHFCPADYKSSHSETLDESARRIKKQAWKRECQWRKSWTSHLTVWREADLTLNACDPLAYTLGNTPKLPLAACGLSNSGKEDDAFTLRWDAITIDSSIAHWYLLTADRENKIKTF